MKGVHAGELIHAYIHHRQKRPTPDATSRERPERRAYSVDTTDPVQVMLSRQVQSLERPFSKTV